MVLRKLFGSLGIFKDDMDRALSRFVDFYRGNVLKPLIISGYSSQDLAQEIAESIGTRVSKVSHKEHEDGEINPQLEGNVRGRDVVIVASGAGDPNTQEKEVRLLRDAAREGGAKAITLLLPYMYYGRSDSNFDTRTAAALADSVRTLREMVDNVIVVDPHNAGVTRALFLAGDDVRSCTPVHFAYPFAMQLKELFNQNVISREKLLLTHPDVGASKRITRNFRRSLYDALDLPLNAEKSDEWAQVIKSRDHKTGTISVSINKDVTGCDIVLFEDMIASGGTACDIAALLKERGARTVTLFATNGLFSVKKPKNADEVMEAIKRTVSGLPEGAMPEDTLAAIWPMVSGLKDGKLRNPTAAIERINNSALDAVFIADTYVHRHTAPAVYEAIQKSPVIHVVRSAPFLGALVSAQHMEVRPDTAENDNSMSALLNGTHPWLRDPARKIAQATPLKPNAKIWNSRLIA